MSQGEGGRRNGGPGRRRGRRGRRTGRRRGLYLLPQLFTTGNLFFGFFAIVAATRGRFDQAAFGIVLAAVFDALDGRVARLAHTSSRFGLEYDSLADVVSFGVAPALLAFTAGHLEVLGRTGWVMSFLFTACAALRLARFNLSSGRYPGRFEGLPSPAAAVTIASTEWFGSFLREHGLAFSLPEPVVAAAVAVVALLMVSAVPYRSFKEIDLRHSFRTLVLAVLILAVLVQEPKLFFFVLSAGYVLLGPAEWLGRRALHRPLPELPRSAPSAASSEGTPS